jgi:hypothetical protein
LATNPLPQSLKQLFEKLSAVLAKTEKWSTPQALTALFILNIIVVAPLVIGHHMIGNPERESLSDLHLFRDRAETIADGDLLYRDTDNATVTPPGINYLLVPPFLLGDTVVIWELWFALFTFLTAAVLFFIIREFEPSLALMGAGLYITNPFSFFTSIGMIQDDTIIPLFVALAMLYLIRRKHTISGTWIGLGSIVKMVPAITAPLLVIGASNSRERLKVIGSGLGVVLLICAPFLILAPSEFMAFLEFYLLGNDPTGRALEGISMWRFLGLAGLKVPNMVNLAMLLASLCTIWFLVAKESLPELNGFALSFMAFFILYSKLHYGYHLLMLLVLIPWAITDWRHMTALVGAGWILRKVHLGWRGRFEMTGGDAGFALLTGLVVLYCAWWSHRLLKGESPSEMLEGKDIERLRTAAALVCLLGLYYAWKSGIDRILAA